MVPSESKRKASSHTPTEKSNEECPVECAENSLSAHEVGEEDKEVVLREVDGEQLLESNKEEVGGVFSSIVTISSTTHHHDEAY